MNSRPELETVNKQQPVENSWMFKCWYVVGATSSEGFLFLKKNLFTLHDVVYALLNGD